MKEKCTKYESLFTFRSEEELMQHIEECEDCRLEHEKMPFHLKVYEGYLTIADLFKDRVVVVNGEQTKQEVLDTVKNVLYPLFYLS